MKPSGGQYQNADAQALPHLFALNEQPHVPLLQVYANPSKCDPGRHDLSQAPQLNWSTLVSVHPELGQYVVPKSHVGGTHLPPTQESAGPHALSQAPQLNKSLWRSLQRSVDGQ
jgi:hypothetical protein